MSTPNRNAPCPCGSGKKYKKCCLNAAAPAQALGHGVNTTNTAPASSSLMQAVTLHQAGKLDEAEAAYRQLLDTNPNDADALHYLGLIALQRGHYQEAADRINGAIRINPLVPAFHCNLGNAYRRLGNPDSAIAAFSEAVRLDPRFQLAYSNMGNIFLGQGKLDDAAASFRKTISIRPDLAEAHYNLGNILRSQNKPDEAMACYRTAISIKPDYAEAYVDLGDTLQAQGKLDAAIENYRWAIAIKPDFSGAHNSLGNSLQLQGKLEEAVASLQRAILLNPDFAMAQNNLGMAFKDLGNLDAAVACFRKALSLKPDFPKAYNNLLFLYSYHSLLAPEEYLAQARNWELSCLPDQARLAARNKTFHRAPLDGRRLRIGYVSGDFCQHAVSYFVEQLFAHHDRSRVELFAYSSNSTQDEVTARLQTLAEHWVQISSIPDAEVCSRIEADGIDVLIDLSGHTRLNRLTVFARRAAPVQAHYLGYFASTGLTEMDYWIGDGFLTPPETDGHFSEKVWRLPRTWLSYDGKADAPLPAWQADQNGAVWLGSFNSLGKLTPATFALWARVLHALPEARLLLKTRELADSGNRQRILGVLSGHGISADRIELQDGSLTPAWQQHMAYYDRLDIALDPVGGVGGGTTTCDALWMGAPLVTLEGDRMASRMTASMLNAIGHPEWVARSEAEYVDKVFSLARNTELRNTLRPAQRGIMANSPLCDTKGLASALENSYIGMFERWLDAKRHPEKVQATGC